MGNATEEAETALERGLNRRHPTDLAGRVVPAGSAPGIPPPSLVDLAVAFPFTFPAWRRQRRGPGEPPAVLPTTPSFLLPPDGAIPGLFGGGDKKGRAAKGGHGRGWPTATASPRPTQRPSRALLGPPRATERPLSPSGRDISAVVRKRETVKTGTGDGGRWGSTKVRVNAATALCFSCFGPPPRPQLLWRLKTCVEEIPPISNEIRPWPRNREEILHPTHPQRSRGAKMG